MRRTPLLSTRPSKTGAACVKEKPASSTSPHAAAAAGLDGFAAAHWRMLNAGAGRAQYLLNPKSSNTSCSHKHHLSSTVVIPQEQRERGSTLDVMESNKCGIKQSGLVAGCTARQLQQDEDAVLENSASKR